MEEKRPLGVSILGGLIILYGMVYLFSAIAILFAFSGRMAPSFLWGVIIFPIIVILVFLIANSFLNGKEWARKLIIVIILLSFVSTVAEIYMDISSSRNLIPAASLILPLIIIYYLTRPRIKMYFKNGEIDRPSIAYPHPFPRYDGPEEERHKKAMKSLNRRISIAIVIAIVLLLIFLLS